MDIKKKKTKQEKPLKKKRCLGNYHRVEMVAIEQRS